MKCRLSAQQQLFAVNPPGTIPTSHRCWRQWFLSAPYSHMWLCYLLIYLYFSVFLWLIAISWSKKPLAVMTRYLHQNMSWHYPCFISCTQFSCGAPPSQMCLYSYIFHVVWWSYWWLKLSKQAADPPMGNRSRKGIICYYW